MSEEVQTVIQRVVLSTSIVAELRSVATFRGGYAERFLPPPQVELSQIAFQYVRRHGNPLEVSPILWGRDPTLRTVVHNPTSGTISLKVSTTSDSGNKPLSFER